MLPSNCVSKKEIDNTKREEHVLMGPNIELVNTVNPMYIQKLNLNAFKAIFQELCQS